MTVGVQAGQQYKAPAGKTPSTAGTQFNTQWYWRKALIDAADEQYFTQLASTTFMPKHYGKKIVAYHYLHVLDDENINDMGINAEGVVTNNGNLYGSSKDIGTVQKALPALSENGGRVNRVGTSRKTVEGTIEFFGIFTDFTRESLEFDSDEELYAHIQREMILAVSSINEDALQIDILNSAGVESFAGSAMTVTDMTGEGSALSVVTYRDLMNLGITLKENLCPTQTKILTGTTFTDTKTIPAGYVMYAGTEVRPIFEAMVDLHGERAYIPVHMYAAGTTVLKGEEGSVGQFRIVEPPRMFHWAGAGATAVEAKNAGYRATDGKYDVFPLLVVGADSFTTIGLTTNGKSMKFDSVTKMPGKETATLHDDPFGQKGFSAFNWYYGFLALRRERIAIQYTVAPL